MLERSINQNKKSKINKKFLNSINSTPSNKMERNGSVVAVVEMDPANDDVYDQALVGINKILDLIDDEGNTWSQTAVYYFYCMRNLTKFRYLFLKIVDNHEDFRNSFLMGTHPKSSSLPLFKLRGEDDVLKIVAEYVGIPKPQDLRILHQVIPRLDKYRNVSLVCSAVIGVVLSFVLRNYLGLHGA